MAKRPEKIKEVGTTGHSWDGIEELNTPLPRWWLWTLYLTIIWGIGYVIAYPAWPLISGATPGVLGYSTRAEVAAEIEAAAARNAPVETALVAADLGLV
jgi:cytochrome c oxidase cbb3-type subunit 3